MPSPKKFVVHHGAGCGLTWFSQLRDNSIVPGKLVFVACMLCCASASASTMQFLDLDQLTKSAQVIVIGTVLASEGRWEKQHTDITTITTVEVSSYLKSGASRPARIYLRHPGGNPSLFEQKTWSMNVDGVPGFKQGQRGMFFLRKQGQFFELVGWTQGLFQIKKTFTGQEIAVRQLDGVFFVNELPDSIPDEMTLNQLVTEVKRRIR